MPESKELQYLNILDNAASMAKLNRAEHKLVVEAVNELKKIIERYNNSDD